MKKQTAVLLIIAAACIVLAVFFLMHPKKEAEPEESTSSVKAPETAQDTESAPLNVFSQGIYLRETSDSVPGLRAYIHFSDAENWWCGGDIAMSFGIPGKYTVSGDRVRAMQTQGMGIREDTYIELQILSETRLKVTAVSEGFFDQKAEWLKAGDVLSLADLPLYETFAGSPLLTMGNGGPCAVLAQYNPYALSVPSEADPGSSVLLQISSGAAEDVLTGNSSSFAVQKNEGNGWETVYDAISDDASVDLSRMTTVFQLLDCGNTFNEHGDGHYRVIKRICVSGDMQYYASDFYVLKHADPKNCQKSTYEVNTREELALSVRWPSVLRVGPPPIAPGYADVWLSLLKDTGIEPICGNSADCIIEELIGGEWYTVPRPTVFMTLEGYMPTLEEPVVQTFFLGGTVQHPGHYRLLKPVNIGRGSEHVCVYCAAEFDVTAELPDTGK